MTRFRADTTIPSTKVASFEKDAFLGAMLGAGSRLLTKTVPRAMGLFLGGQTPSRITKNLAPVGRYIERGLGNAASSVMSPGAAATTQRLMRGVPQRMIRDTVGGAFINAGMEGGMSALTAEPGQGGSAFMSGAASGVLSGAAMGAIGGLGGGIIRNKRRMGLADLSRQSGVSRGEIGKRNNDLGFFKAVKGSFGKVDNLDRQISRHKAVGGAAQFGADMILPMALMPGHKEDAPPPPAMPALAPNAPTVYSQPQYFKGGSATSRLKPIDFTKIPSYHR